ncbi:hypothetical protein [Anatilimnocola floriformis]|uniref:hypothetical protein n=1 Tax=Anatilimnocola floriformis TaxID=2948575 RepID=UPI0020C2B6D2|nr:hypothetical protein [Anatilimnocola floriformis]
MSGFSVPIFVRHNSFATGEPCLPYTCDACRHAFVDTEPRTAVGSVLSPFDILPAQFVQKRTQERAARNLKRLLTEPHLAACPRCGHFQRATVRYEQRKQLLGDIGTTAYYIIGLTVIFSAIDYVKHGGKAIEGIGIIAGFCVLIAAVVIAGRWLLWKPKKPEASPNDPYLYVRQMPDYQQLSGAEQAEAPIGTPLPVTPIVRSTRTARTMHLAAVDRCRWETIYGVMAIIVGAAFGGSFHGRMLNFDGEQMLELLLLPAIVGFTAAGMMYLFVSVAATNFASPQESDEEFESYRASRRVLTVKPQAKPPLDPLRAWQLSKFATLATAAVVTPLTGFIAFKGSLSCAGLMVAGEALGWLALTWFLNRKAK